MIFHRNDENGLDLLSLGGGCSTLGDKTDERDYEYALNQTEMHKIFLRTVKHPRVSAHAGRSFVDYCGGQCRLEPATSCL